MPVVPGKAPVREPCEAFFRRGDPAAVLQLHAQAHISTRPGGVAVTARARHVKVRAMGRETVEVGRLDPGLAADAYVAVGVIGDDGDSFGYAKRAAAEAEHKISLVGGIKAYPRAVPSR
ncbi:hypothetical protein SEUCBS139899_006648 [Sporothrix eucalyptigena]